MRGESKFKCIVRNVCCDPERGLKYGEYGCNVDVLGRIKEGVARNFRPVDAQTGWDRKDPHVTLPTRIFPCM